MINNWKNIHLEFVDRLQSQWEAEGFTYQEVKDWINIGLKPTDYKLASYIRYKLGYKSEEALNFADLPTLRTVYQESLSEQLENLQIQPTIYEPEIIEREPIPEVPPQIPPQKPTIQEEIDLTEALILSLDLSRFDDDGETSSSSDEEEEEINWEELEPYLSEKRLDLKKYFVFNLGKEVKITPKITVSDKSGKLKSDPIPNIRKVKPLLVEHLTQLFNDGEKSAISFTGKNINQLSLEWSGDKLDQKIRNGEEVYIVFDKRKINANSSYIRSRADSITQLGPLDWPEIIVLAVEAKPRVRVFQSKRNALKFLKNYDPVLSGKRNLYEWWKEEKKLADSQKERLVKMGVNDKEDNSKEYKLEELKRILKYEDIAKQNQGKIPFEEGEIKKIIFFSPPRFQDKDCVLVVSQKERPQIGIEISPLLFSPLIGFSENSPKLWLIIYEEPWKNIGNSLYVKRLDNKLCWDLDDAESKADILVDKLMNRKNPYPACAVFDRVKDVFESFSFQGDIEGVKGFVSPWSAKNNPDGYFKPFDIVRVENPFYSHVGIYLGKDKNNKHKIIQVTKKNNGLYIADWEELFSNNSYDLSRYHPFVTYKKTRLIRKHIARAYASGDYNGAYALLFGTNDYKKGNCQHFANRAVLGLNISNEGTLFKRDRLLKEEMERTSRHFNNLSIIGNNRRFYRLLRKGIREFANEANDQTRAELKKTGEGKYTAQIIHNPQWKWKQPVELRPSKNCKIQ